MNYGRFFKLNQTVSSLESGVTVYDYIDLPAFFGPSAETPQTPKHPVNLTITSDSVLFRLHYSSFKVEEDDNNPQYRLKLDEALNTNTYTDTAFLDTVHMEEVILTLPFADTHLLADNIKRVYSTLFPMPMKNGNCGGRWFQQLLEKRYKNEGCSQIEKRCYENLNKASAGTYSCLARMGMVDDNGENKVATKLPGKPMDMIVCNVYDGENKVATKFLRKLLLDFMFDLRHSDIFQLNPHYRQMVSGLMSNPYFSSLQHKCEYYHMLELTVDRVGDIKSKDNLNILDIVSLYGEDLLEAENLWVNDIMSPNADCLFGYSQEPSWFEPPEQEMRRVYFLDRDKKNEKKQTADSFIRNFKLRKPRKYPQTSQSQLESIRHMVHTHDCDRENASRWFLRRYDFNDVFRLHFFKYASCFVTLAATILLVMVISNLQIKWPWYCTIACAIILGVVSVSRMIIRKEHPRHAISLIHLMMPRLVASIATAWFTLALSFDLFVSFFDSKPSFWTITFITVVLFVFIFYKINQNTPDVELKHKLWRSIQMIVFCGLISFVTGIVLINFTGEKFLERGDYIDNFYKERVSLPNDTCDREFVYIGDIENITDSNHIVLRKELCNVYYSDNGKAIKSHPVVETHKVLWWEIFIMRDFLITFAFVAMFIGIFIQLIILGDNKQLTEL